MELYGLVGQRVSLRQRIGERDGRPLYSDAVGVLTSDGDGWTVLARHGPVPVVQDAVVAVRAVPPAPPRRAPLAAVTRLEGLCADAWPARTDEPMGGWRLRAAGGWTGRANSALAIGHPDRPVPAALDAVREFAARHGIGPRVMVPVGSPWDRAVAAQGWVLDTGHAAGAEVAVLVTELAGLAGPDGPDGYEVELPQRPDPDWWRLCAGGEPAGIRHGPGAAAPMPPSLVIWPDQLATGPPPPATVG